MGTHEQGATPRLGGGGRRGADSSPYLGEGPTPRLEPQSPLGCRLTPPPSYPQPRLSSLSLLSFTSSLPLALLPTPPPPGSLLAPLSFFAYDRALSWGRAGAAPPLPCPSAQTPGPAPALRNHAVRPLDVSPPPPAA